MCVHVVVVVVVACCLQLRICATFFRSILCCVLSFYIRFLEFYCVLPSVFFLSLPRSRCIFRVCVCLFTHVFVWMHNISSSYFILCKHATYDNKQQRLTTANEIACFELYYDVCDFTRCLFTWTGHFVCTLGIKRVRNTCCYCDVRK